MSISLRGEYWIEDGEVHIECGDAGEYNHEGYALQAACTKLCDAIGVDYNDTDELVEVIREFLDDEEHEKHEPQRERLKRWMKENQPDDVDLVDPAFNMAGDIREYAMKVWGWKWVRWSWVGTHELKREDFNQISEGFYSIIDGDGHDPDSPEVREHEIHIKVVSNGNEYCVSLGDLFDKNYSIAGITSAEMEATGMDRTRGEDQKLMPEFYRGKFGD